MGILEKMRLDGKKAFVTGGARGIGKCVATALAEDAASMTKAVVLGSLNVDLVADVPRPPFEGESLLADSFTVVAGGKGANQACTLSRLGAESAVLGMIGKDGYGTMLKESLEKAGVDYSHLDEREDTPTGVAMISVYPNGNNSIVSVLGANNRVDCDYIDRNLDLLKECDVFVLQLEVPLEAAAYAAKKAKEFGKLVVLDPAPAPEILPEGLLDAVDLVKPNEVELSILTGIQEAEHHLAEAVGVLKQMGARDVLVTLGSKGSCVSMPDGSIRMIEAKKVKAVDTTAAGDAFTASVAIKLAEGKSLLEAAEFATGVSAIVVTRKGAQSSIPTQEELKGLL